MFTRKVLIVLAAAIGVAILWAARGVLVLVFIAAILAAGIAPLVHRVRVLWRFRFRRNLPRGAAVERVRGADQRAALRGIELQPVRPVTGGRARDRAVHAGHGALVRAVESVRRGRGDRRAGAPDAHLLSRFASVPVALAACNARSGGGGGVRLRAALSRNKGLRDEDPPAAGRGGGTDRRRARGNARRVSSFASARGQRQHSVYVDRERTAGHAALALPMTTSDRAPDTTPLERGRAAMKRLEEIFKVEPTIVSPARGAALASLEKGIEFRHVSFVYDHLKNGHPILQDISFSLPAGRTVGLVGRVGSGKTTLARRMLDSADCRVWAIDRDPDALCAVCDPAEDRRPVPDSARSVGRELGLRIRVG